MKPILKYMFYVVVIILLVIGSLMLYRVHPEAQLAFLIPGFFILAYSKLTDELRVKQGMRFIRGK